MVGELEIARRPGRWVRIRSIRPAPGAIEDRVARLQVGVASRSAHRARPHGRRPRPRCRRRSPGCQPPPCLGRRVLWQNRARSSRVEPAAVIQLQRRHTHALVVDAAGGDRHRPGERCRRRPSGCPTAMHSRRDSACKEDRPQDEEVRGVGDRTLAHVRIVEGDHVPVAQVAEASYGECVKNRGRWRCRTGRSPSGRDDRRSGGTGLTARG